MGEILDRTRMAVEPAAITRKGRTLAYLVPAEWFEHYQELAAAQDTAGQDAA
ncbi:type II toxin-antitoxin system Phd/YefM family antitoxin [Streptomyces sp. NPDC006703]|uniref:type II toxin-antitoxin system Phd/YefM family antitoxin n=2 Tax=unclassified Streptomyces TaxID=2593676 RepID=UPI0036B72534